MFDAQLDKAFAIADTDHLLTYGTTIKQHKVTGPRTGGGTCLTVGRRLPVIGATSAADILKTSSDFPDPTINTYSLFAQDEISWSKWTFLPGPALRLHRAQAAHHRRIPGHRGRQR